MSTLQVQTINFESTANTSVVGNSSVLTFKAGGNTAMTINTSAVSYSGNLSIGGLTINGTVTYASANIAQQTLTDAATISWDTSLGQVATVTIAGNRAVANATNLKVGYYTLHVIQDGTGSRTLTWGGIYKWPAGVAPTLTTNASARDIITFISDGTSMYGTYINNVK